MQMHLHTLYCSDAGSFACASGNLLKIRLFYYYVINAFEAQFEPLPQFQTYATPLRFCDKKYTCTQIYAYTVAIYHVGILKYYTPGSNNRNCYNQHFVLRTDRIEHYEKI